MSMSPFIEALVSPKNAVSAKPLESALPRRDSGHAPLLARLSKAANPALPTGPADESSHGAAEQESHAEREAAMMARLHATLAELERVRTHQPKPLDVAELAITAARAVLNHELKTRRDVLRLHIEDACRALEGERSLRVRLHPDLAETYLKGPRPDPFGLEVLSDASLEPGAIIVEGERSAADASVETRLAQFGEALAAELRNHEAPAVSGQEQVA